MDTASEVNILLVEDDVVDQMALKRAFKSLRITNPLSVAKDGIEGLEFLRAESQAGIDRPYLIILDLNMPRMTGHEFLKELRADEDLKDSVVFVLTTSKDEEDVVKSYNLNVAGYVVKGNMGESFTNAIKMIEHYWRVVILPL